MSKRFGRTQKRELREKVAALEVAYNRELSLIAYFEKYEKMYKELIDEIKRWWDYSILAPIKTEELDEFPPIFRTVQRDNKPLSFEVGPLSSMELHYQTLEAIEIPAHRDSSSMKMAVIVRTPDGSRQMYISQRAIYEMQGFPKNVGRFVYEEISRSLAAEMRRN